ncbi:MAG: glycosyltransferase [Microbacteriaceae bacterium]|nr:glycosyltransferase [Microbacteriaceae bacterium]
MQQRVTAILVARSGAEYLQRTLAAVDRQARRPDFLIAVDAGSSDNSASMLTATGPAQLVAAPAKASFGEAVAHAVHVAAPAVSDNEWLWLLAHDNAPEPDALARLLGAVEIAPSVSVAGPKLMGWTRRDVIAEFGESMTPVGTSVRLVEDELDQAQHDIRGDVLGVAASGMLVRRSVWTALGGFDPALPSTDAALDFCVRARLAGHRVIVVPGARVASAGGPQHFGRRALSDRRRMQISRSAQLHRRLVYAPPAALPLHWLSLIPLAIIRSIVHLLAKRPGAVGAELVTALRAAFDVVPVIRARRNLRRTSSLGWKAIAPLRLSWRRAREQRTHRQDDGGGTGPAGPAAYREEPIGFVTGGGLWAVLGAGLVGLVPFGGLLGANSVSGGGLLPLGSVGKLWAQVGYGWREIGVGFTGAADPFSYVLALLGSLAFWQPSAAIVALYVLALPLATLGAWFAARRFTVRPWPPALAAVLWGIAPPFLSSLGTGHLGASIAHLLLPWLVLLALAAGRSWTAAAGAALVFAAVTASAPVLTPALLGMWLALVLSSPRRAYRLLGIPLPAAALVAPLVIDQILRGNPLGLLADPGVPTAGGASSGIQLALGSAAGGSNGWTALFDRVLLPAATAPTFVAALLLPLGLLAFLGLFVRGSRRSIPALAVALLGYATAVISTRLELAAVGSETVGIWPGSGLSLFWLGLIGAALVSLDAIGAAARGFAVLLGVASLLLAVPLVGSNLLGTLSVQPGPARLLPAFVDAEATSRPKIGTLILAPEGEGAIAASLERGRGTLLEQQSTLDATAVEMSDADARLANLAGNLASRSGYDSAPDLDDLAIGFIVLEGADADADAGAASADEAEAAVLRRTQDALDGNSLLIPVGETSRGLLWRYVGEADTVAVTGPSNTGSVLGIIVLIGQGLIVGMTVLLAVPTARRRREHVSRGTENEEPATTFDEDTDD